MFFFVVFFFKQKTVYEMRISDWSSDVCSSDLPAQRRFETEVVEDRRAQQARELAGIVEGVGTQGDRVVQAGAQRLGFRRSGGRRVGKECVSTCSSRWSPCHYKTKNKVFQ